LTDSILSAARSLTVAAHVSAARRPRLNTREAALSDVIYLIRHAEAEPAGQGGDRGRALTEKGRRAFALLLESARGAMTVKRIVSSPYDRALQTAAIVGAAVTLEVDEERALASGESSGAEILALARRLGAGTALVGHNPEIAEAIAQVARRGQAVAPGTIAAVELRPDGLGLLWLRSP
jgi:phosphohistidine phosphatase